MPKNGGGKAHSCQRIIGTKGCRSNWPAGIRVNEDVALMTERVHPSAPRFNEHILSWCGKHSSSSKPLKMRALCLARYMLS